MPFRFLITHQYIYLIVDPVPEPLVCEPTPAVEKNRESTPEGATALPPPPAGKGWYYNYEEDRYSFCDSESDQSPEREVGGTSKVVPEEGTNKRTDTSDRENLPENAERPIGDITLEASSNVTESKAAAVRVIQRTINSARAKSKSSSPSKVKLYKRHGRPH